MTSASLRDYELTDQEGDRASAFRRFIASDDFPCVGAKAALTRGELTITEHGLITRPTSDVDIRRQLGAFIETLEPGGWALQSFVAVFEGPLDLDEHQFEAALWNRLQCLHNLDVVAGQDWTEAAASDPEAAHFSMSLLGQPFFVIGLHPNASRPARRFDYPAMVFNSHAQFDALREDGRFERMQKAIRKRDAKIAGSINPMLNDFGEASEAPQYSGRKVDENWVCPFQKKDVGG